MENKEEHLKEFWDFNREIKEKKPKNIKNIEEREWRMVEAKITKHEEMEEKDTR